jgi:hypothetical protein
MINGVSCAALCPSGSYSYLSYGGSYLLYFPGSGYTCGSIVTASSGTYCSLNLGSSYGIASVLNYLFSGYYLSATVSNNFLFTGYGYDNYSFVM